MGGKHDVRNEISIENILSLGFLGYKKRSDIKGVDITECRVYTTCITLLSG